jgi:hypothetical protein
MCIYNVCACGRRSSRSRRRTPRCPSPSARSTTPASASVRTPDHSSHYPPPPPPPPSGFPCRRLPRPPRCAPPSHTPLSSHPPPSQLLPRPRRPITSSRFPIPPPLSFACTNCARHELLERRSPYIWRVYVHIWTYNTDIRTQHFLMLYTAPRGRHHRVRAARASVACSTLKHGRAAVMRSSLVCLSFSVTCHASTQASPSACGTSCSSSTRCSTRRTARSSRRCRSRSPTHAHITLTYAYGHLMLFDITVPIIFYCWCVCSPMYGRIILLYGHIILFHTTADNAL